MSETTYDQQRTADLLGFNRSAPETWDVELVNRFVALEKSDKDRCDREMNKWLRYQRQAPLALTDQHVSALEKAIRAEGFDIFADPETGDIKLERVKE